MRDADVKARSGEFLGLKKHMSGAIRHVTISGRVQGVGYRAWVEDEALVAGSRGLGAQSQGRQRRGAVCGPADVVAAMIAACRRGPSSARVEALQDEAANPDMLNLRRAGERFSVLPTI